MRILSAKLISMVTMMSFLRIPWPYLFFFLSPADLKSFLDHVVGSGWKNTTHQENGRGTTTTPSLSLRPRIVSLNVMVAGLSGLGKTTTCAVLIESWQQQDSPLRFARGDDHNKNKRKPKITKVVDPSRQFERYDERTNTILRVRIIDTPGFGNRVNHRHAVRPIIKYMHNCRSNQFEAETGAALPDQNVEACDDLVHVCLYFLSPGRFLEMDAYFLSRIQSEVCIIPVIAKADTLTDQELAAHRADVVQAFAKQGIAPYNFDARHHKNYANNNSEHSESTTAPYHRGRRTGESLALVARDGKYPWGHVTSVDPGHSDLLLVRDLLLSQHTETLVELAREKYGAYRARRIRQRHVGDALKYTALALLTARALGVQLPFMDQLTPTAVSTQLKQWAAFCSNLLDKVKEGTSFVWNSRTKDEDAATELPSLKDIFPEKDDFTHQNDNNRSAWRWFGWNTKGRST